jgi:import inner membrane translocase subunit TIM10
MFAEGTDTTIRRSCHSKCINQRYLDGELSKGESVCVDRCVAKFFDANKKMGEKLQTMGAAAGSAGGFTSL